VADPEHGYGKLNVQLDVDALAHLVNVANGDARGVLNALELAVETTQPDENGVIRVTLDVAEESIQRRAVLYDKEGDVHYDTISAFIKSLRGSDPDAAMYWMARMVYAGEDPRFIFRRMIVFAGEDVGLADPNAVRVVMACAQAYDYVGLPEGRFHLAEAALYLATAPKSNSAFAFFDALGAVEKEREADVPAHLRDANRDAEGFGHGEGYLYPHAYRDHWVAQQYLPDALQGRVFYQPGEIGYEQAIRAEVGRRREAQLAAMMEGAEGFGASEVLTYTGGKAGNERDRWLARAVSGAGERLGELRDRVIDAARLQRHSLALDLNAGSGLLTWEAARRTPEGGVWSVAATTREAEALRDAASRLPPVERPTVLQGTLTEVRELLALRGEDVLRFDAVVGRNALTPAKGVTGVNLDGVAETAASYGDLPAHLVEAAGALKGLLRASGVISLAELIGRRSQRLYALIDLARLGPELAEKARAAEEAIYESADDPWVNWDEETLRRALERAGFADVTVEAAPTEIETRLQPATLDRWFGTAPAGERPTYRQRLAALLTAEELAAVEALYRGQLTGQTAAWRSVHAFAVARRPQDDAANGGH
jgi:putative ATPase